MSSFIVLGDRECGSVAGGGLYAVGLENPFGTLKKFTAVAAPFDAEVKNARKGQLIGMTKTLTEAWGLHDPTGDDEPYKSLPGVGVADLWGRVYYKTVWSAIEETKRMGACRRLTALPKGLETPYPVLMLHMEAFVEIGVDRDDVESWLCENFAGELDPNPPWLAACGPEGHEGYYNVFDWAWQDADSLGRTGDDDFMWHSHVALWGLVPLLKKKRLYSRFMRECEVTTSQGVCGLTWITHHVQVLRQDQDDVDPSLFQLGVLAAVGEHDPRAAG